MNIVAICSGSLMQLCLLMQEISGLLKIMQINPEASSDFAGKRFAIIRDIHGYIENIHTGGQVLREVQDVPHRERAGEYLMMRLRLSSGVDPVEYEKLFLLPFAPLEQVLLQCKERGLAVKTFDGRWHLTPEGYLLSNTILTDLLLVQEKT